MKKILNKFKTGKGATLIEVLMYLAIFSIVVPLLIQILTGTFSVFAKVRATRGLTVSGTSIMETLATNIRAASSYSSSGNNFNTNLGSLSLQIEDGGSTHTYLYTVSNGRLMEKIDSNAAQYISPSGQTVSSFYLTNITSGTISGVVVNLVLLDSRITPNIEAAFINTILMRGDY